MTSVYENNFNCGICLKVTRNRSIKSIDIERKKKLCWGNKDRSTKPLVTFDSGWRVWICPGRLHGTFERSLIYDYYRLRDFSLLPRPGSVGEQPAWWIEAMDFIRGECNRWDEILAEKKQSKQRRDELRKKLQR